jgi:hypothetical protein
MLYDIRTYTVRPGTIKKQIALYSEFGFQVQVRHLGKPFAYFLPETGELNSYTHIWVYEDAADRERKRKALSADPEWQAYGKKSAYAGYLSHQENRLMNNASFMD